MKNIVKLAGQLFISILLCGILVFGAIGAFNLFIS